MYRLLINFIIVIFIITYQINAQIHIVVNNSQTHQQIYGFGATTGMLVYGSKDNLTPTLRSEAIEAVYSKVKINMGNIPLGIFETPNNAADTWGERKNDDNDPFHYEQKGFNWSAINNMNKKIIKPGLIYGFNSFYPANSISMRWEQIWLSDIKNIDYQRFLDECGEHVSAGIHYWKDSLNLPIKYMMLFNEPTSGNTELTGGSGQTVTDIIKAVGYRLVDEGFSDVKFVVPGEETEERSLLVAKTILDDPEARQFVGAIAYHTYPYGSIYSSVPNILATSGSGKPDKGRIQIRNQLRDISMQYNIPLWMTEVSHGVSDPRSMDDLQGRAIHIHDEFIYANASAYFGMGNMWDKTSQKMHFGNTDLYSGEGTIALIDNDSNKLTITGIGYAIGHYARWITPGSYRIDAVSSDSLVQVTTYRDDVKNKMIFVLINNADIEKLISVQIKNATITGDINGEQSYEDIRWKEISSLSVMSQTGFEVILPSKSVSSYSVNFVIENTGIIEDNIKNNYFQPLFYLSPNPCTDKFEIHFDYNNKFHNPCSFKIVNDLGFTMWEKKNFTPEINLIEIDTKNYPSGIYFCIINSGIYSESKRIVLVK